MKKMPEEKKTEKEEKISEDYQWLLIYKENITEECREEMTNRLAQYFFEKYKEEITRYCDRYTGKYVFKGNEIKEISYEERVDYSLSEDWIEQEEAKFMNAVLNYYIPQALNSFKIEIITNKSSYKFITYINNYLKHALRDLSGRRAKEMNVKAEETEVSEDNLIESIDSKIMEEKIRKIIAVLTPLQQKIYGYLSQGKKQCQIEILNPETGNYYSKGYINKQVQKIRTELRKLKAD